MNRISPSMDRAPRFGLLLALGLALPACTAPGPASPTATSVPATDVLVSETPLGEEPSPVASPTSLDDRLPFPDPADYIWEPFVSGLEQPLDIQNSGDGSGRLFVVERTGRIRIVREGALMPEPFLDLSNLVSTVDMEQGLLGLAFHPDYAVNGFFYVNYTDLQGNTIVARFRTLEGEPDRADPYSGTRLLSVLQPYPNHNGGGLAFGPDGYLYIGMGDGGSAGDPLGNAQNPRSLLGKILRIEGGRPGGEAEIWAFGLRNPWRFSFDPATGDLYIGDVGQYAWEEVDFVPAGGPASLNFGWNVWEGQHVYTAAPEGIDFVFPVVEYAHSGEDGLPGGCSITAGVVYRGVLLPEWDGIYFFGDYCRGWVAGLVRTQDQVWQVQPLFETGATPAGFGVDETGEVYLADYMGGRLLRLERR